MKTRLIFATVLLVGHLTCALPLAQLVVYWRGGRIRQT